MNRRLFLLSTTALGLSACATFNSNFATAADDVSSIADAFLKLLAEPTVISLVPENILQQASVWASELQQAAAALKAAVTTGGAQSAVKQAEDLINAIVGILAKFVPPPFSQYLLFASVLLPIIEAAVGLLIKPAAINTTVSPEQARIGLKAYAQKK